MKKTFIFNMSNNNDMCTNCQFHKSTDYSKTLDNIIATNIMETNTYLKPYKTNNDDFIGTMMKKSSGKSTYIFNNDCHLKSDFIKAADFLANYKKNDIKSKFILGKTYKLLDGTSIIFYSDEIQIGLDLFSYDDFKDITFLKAIPDTTKNLIINFINIKL